MNYNGFSVLTLEKFHQTPPRTRGADPCASRDFKVKISNLLGFILYVLPVVLLMMGCGERENKHLVSARFMIQQDKFKLEELKGELNIVLKEERENPEALCPLKAIEIISPETSREARQEAVTKIISLVSDLENKIREIESIDEDLRSDEDKDTLEKLKRKWDLSLEPSVTILKSETGWINDVGQTAMDLLIESLKVSDPKLQSDVMELLVSLRDQSFDVLIGALQNENIIVRRQAVIALGKIGDERAVEHIALMLNDQDPGVRFYVPVSLDMIGGQKIIEPLHRALKNEIAQVRTAAADILGRLEDQTGMDLLLELLADDNSYVKTSATNALIKIGEPAVVKLIEILEKSAENISLLSTDYVGDKIGNRFKKELAKRSALQVSAASILGSIGDPLAINPLLGAMQREAGDNAAEEEKTNAASVRSGATAALIVIGPATVESLIRILESSENENASINAASILGSIGDKRAVDPLINALKDSRKGVRAAAAESLGKLKDRRATKPLVEALKDTDVVTRTNAAVSLGTIKDKSATQALIDVVMDTTEREKIRDSAISSLGTIQDTKALEILVKVLIDEYEKDGIRKSAANALRTIENVWPSEALIGLLRGEIVYGIFMPKKGVISKWLKQEGDKNLIKDFTPLVEILAEGEHIELKAPNSGILLKIYVKAEAEANTLIGLISFMDKEIKQEERSSIRSVAASALGKVKGDGALPALMHSLRKDKSAVVRMNAASSLRELEKADARSVLIDALKGDDSGVVRNEAAYALGVVKGADSVPPLIHSLRKDKYESTRVKSAWSLGEIADKRAVESLIDSIVKGRKGQPEANAVIADVITALDKIAGPAVAPLVEVLKDTSIDEVSRSKAARIFGLIESVDATEPLTTAFKDNSIVVRSEAAKSLGLIADRRSVELLINVLKDEDEWITVRANAATSLGKIKDERAVMPLIEVLKSGVPAIRDNAVVALGLIEDKRATIPLVQILENEKEDDNIRANAVSSLGSIADARAVNALIMALKSNVGAIRQNAAVALGEHGAGVGPLAAIVGNLNEPVALRASAAEALGKIKDKSVILLLRQRLADYNESDTVWSNMAVAAGKMRADQLPAWVSERAQDTWETAGVRYAAFMAMSGTYREQYYSVILELLSNATKEIRSGAALALGEIGRKDAVQPLIDKLQNDAEEIVRRDSAKALAALADPSSEQALIKAHKEDADSVKIEAAIALGNIKGRDGIAALISTLPDTAKARSVRLTAAKALGDAGSAEAVPALRTALEDKIGDIHFEAAEALRKITGENFGYER